MAKDEKWGIALESIVINFKFPTLVVPSPTFILGTPTPPPSE